MSHQGETALNIAKKMNYRVFIRRLERVESDMEGELSNEVPDGRQSANRYTAPIGEQLSFNMGSSAQRVVENEPTLCVICLGNERSIALAPCGHRCLCTSCGASNNVRACPVCRRRVDSTLHVFL